MKLKLFLESLLKLYGDLHGQTTGRGQDLTEFFIYYYIQVLQRRKIQTKSRLGIKSKKVHPFDFNLIFYRFTGRLTLRDI